MNKKYAYSALLYDENYIKGVIGLQTSLKYVKTKYPFFILADENLPEYVFNFLAKERISFKKIKMIIPENKIGRYDKIINYF